MGHNLLLPGFFLNCLMFEKKKKKTSILENKKGGSLIVHNLVSGPKNG